MPVVFKRLYNFHLLCKSFGASRRGGRNGAKFEDSFVCFQEASAVSERVNVLLSAAERVSRPSSDTQANERTGEQASQRAYG